MTVLIIGAGVSGLLLAQFLRKSGISFQIFERDADFSTRGLGWGLTLHWSLPALRTLLPDDLFRRLPEAYVDRLAVEKGELSTFPFFDLSTGELKAATPKAPESQRIRVTRERLRRLLATGIDVHWGKAFSDFRSDSGSITACFADGSSCVGSLLVGCDGANSRVRKALLPGQHQNYPIPVRVMGVRADCMPKQILPLRTLDPFFLQGTASVNDSFMYFSMLDAPGNNEDSGESYSCQIVVSWPFRAGFFNRAAPMSFPPTNAARLELIRTFAKTWAEPFRSLALNIPDGTEVKHLDLSDWPPPKGLRSTGRAVLMGDASHAMAMYRGEGANHAIIDVLDFAEHVAPRLGVTNPDDFRDLREALDRYEDAVVDRTRPAVLASRRACLDAHEWSRIGSTSPLLSRRAMKLEFNEDG